MDDDIEKALSKLPPRRRRFVEEYAVDLNATQAAIRAGYAKKTAKSEGARLLSFAAVKDAIAAVQAKMSAESSLTVAKVLEDIERVRGLAEDNERFGEAMRASELQGKYLKMWVDRVEHSVDQQIADRILSARERAGEE